MTRLARNFMCCASMLAFALVGSFAPAAPLIIRSAVGPSVASIQATVDQFRADLGVGYEEVTFDKVPDSLASGGLSPLPNDFFNRAPGDLVGEPRGMQLDSSGQIEVSADNDSDNDGIPGPMTPLFGNRHPDNQADFAAYSEERIVGLMGDHRMDVRFSVPGEPSRTAHTRGFGAVFTDVETYGSTIMRYFDVNGHLLHESLIEPFPFLGADSGKSLSFVGVLFEDPVIYRVEIIAGTYDLSLTPFGDQALADAIAMDNFVYSPPKAIPEPSSVLLFAASFAALAYSRHAPRTGR